MTFRTHLLLIDEVPAAAASIGLTFCPGKVEVRAASGWPERDLDLDLEVVRDWGAAAVVTLVEDHELEKLGVRRLGDAVRDRHMDWLHLPIVDWNAPCARFEAEWESAGEGIRARLRSGFRVLVHCRYGFGRAGTIAARLLAELGADPEEAVTAVRQIRPGAIDAQVQEEHVRRIRPRDEARPDQSPASRRDRALGALLGLAVGDAIGTTLESAERDQEPRLDDMIGAGPFGLRPGQWTDDTAMALALADSLLAAPSLDAADLMSRFEAWMTEGDYSCTGTCLSIGMTTQQAIWSWMLDDNPNAGPTDEQTAGNGSLMRLSPVAIRWWNDRAMLAEVAARQSRTTHGAAAAVDACVAFSAMLADAIEGRTRSEVLSPGFDVPGRVGSIIAGSWRGKDRSQIESTGWVVHTLEAALWCVGRTATFEDAVLLAANLGDDADTTAAVAGQLAGALYGASAIPQRWLERLAWRNRLERAAGALWQASMKAATPPLVT